MAPIENTEKLEQLRVLDAGFAIMVGQADGCAIGIDTIEDYKKGDVDGDGVVDLADAVLVINHYVGKPVNKFVTKAADVDGDGVIDLADAVRIINFYVGKVQSLAPSVGSDGLDPQ